MFFFFIKYRVHPSRAAALLRLHWEYAKGRNIACSGKEEAEITSIRFRVDLESVGQRISSHNSTLQSGVIEINSISASKENTPLPLSFGQGNPPTAYAFMTIFDNLIICRQCLNSDHISRDTRRALPQEHFTSSIYPPVIFITSGSWVDHKALGYSIIMKTESVHSRTSEQKDPGQMTHVEMVDGVRVEVLQGSMALDLARRTDPPNPWSRSMLRLYGFLTVGYLCSALNGTIKGEGH